jgi:hypothetical protein
MMPMTSICFTYFEIPCVNVIGILHHSSTFWPGREGGRARRGRYVASFDMLPVWIHFYFRKTEGSSLLTGIEAIEDIFFKGEVQ